MSIMIKRRKIISTGLIIDLIRPSTPSSKLKCVGISGSTVTAISMAALLLTVNRS